MDENRAQFDKAKTDLRVAIDSLVRRRLWEVGQMFALADRLAAQGRAAEACRIVEAAARHVFEQASQ